MTNADGAAIGSQVEQDEDSMEVGTQEETQNGFSQSTLLKMPNEETQGEKLDQASQEPETVFGKSSLLNDIPGTVQSSGLTGDQGSAGDGNADSVSADAFSNSSLLAGMGTSRAENDSDMDIAGGINGFSSSSLLNGVNPANTSNTEKLNEGSSATKFTTSSLLSGINETGNGWNDDEGRNGYKDSRYESMIQDTRTYDGESRAFYTARLASGKVISIHRDYNKKQKGAETHLDRNTEGRGRNYYGIPIHKMLADLEREKLDRLGETRATEPPKTVAPSEQKLLSEKWRPSKWIDLVGPEKVHRFMLRWLVAWSSVVFGTTPPDDNRGLERVDAFGRPHKKVLLIHGPPGIGKTTVAHILAKQAGYDVVEINASDERSGPQVRTKIQNSMNNHRVIGSGKPVCIVADEIEGAAESGFIRVLLNMIESDSKALSQRQQHQQQKKKKKKNSPKLMQRPIIAICNDLYAPSLRELRSHAEVVTYTNITNHTMVNRLRDICRIEKINLDTSELKEIAETTQGDLRSSLNILQFGITRNPDGSVAKKDLNKNWSTLANRVFKRDNTVSRDIDTKSVIQEIDGYGEYDKLMTGCFSLYPKINYNDDMMAKPCELGEWTHFYEQLNAAIYGSQHPVGHYLSQPILAFHSLFSTQSMGKTERAKNDYEVFEAARRNSALCREFLSYTNTQIRQIFDIKSAAMELAPYALQIISPNIDTPATMKPAEKAKVKNSAHALMCLNASFRRDKLEGGTVIYRIDPPIEQLVSFDQDQRQIHTVGRYTTRQAINEVVHQEKAKRNQPLAEKRRNDSETAAEPTKKRKVQQKKQKKVDFFGRVIEESINSEGGTETGVKEQDNHVWVQYVEGFSNAVRKELTWKDLWT
jgi:chromosome transmission fidelity protein 18